MVDSSGSGDVVYLDVIGQPLVILSSMQAVEDLVVRESSIFSARPILTMVSDLYMSRTSSI